MKHWLCSCPGCGHEWDGEREVCDWCNAPGNLLRETSTSDFAKIIGSIAERMVNRRQPDYRKKMH